VLASVLLGSEPPWLPTALLVRTAELFGITAGTTRTALSRMTAAGELVSRDGGYELAGHLRRRQERQHVSRRADTRAWDGTWELAVVSGRHPRSAATRAALREALDALRLAELREGVWGRPANLDPRRSPEARAVAAGQVRWWQGARPVDADADPAELWDLGGWTAGAEELRAEMAQLVDRLEAGDTAVLAPGFVTSAAVLRHLQADPLLPPELLPPRWPGDAVRHDYDRYDTAYRALLVDWFARTG
jgi:phenylacetic acid degradation operon negative regulatory protein